MARSFNGTSDYIEHGAAVVTAVPITMACWFHQTQSAVRTLLAIGDSAADTKVYLWLPSTNLLNAQTTAVGGGTGIAVTTASVQPNRWQHACGVFASATDRRAFLNGANKGTNTTDRILGTPTVVTVGTRYSSGVRGAFMYGLIAEAAIWNVALDDSEVALLGQGYYPDQIRRGNLVAYWPLVGQYSPNEIDRKGRFDAVVNGAKPAIADHPPMIPRTRRSRALEYAVMFPSDQPPAANPARIIFSHA